MKNIAIGSLIILIFSYLLFSFGNVNFNIKNWSESTRWFYVFINAFIIFLLVVNENINKNTKY